MKILIKSLTLALALFSTPFSFAQSKNLIVYFTQPENIDINNIDAYSGASVILKNGQTLGATEYLARQIQSQLGGDLFSIETEQVYPDTHQPLLDFAQEEQRKNIKPTLKAKPNLEDYDTVFVGYPIWWYQMPMPLYTFFEQNNFSGKQIVLFVAHGGSRFSGTPDVIRKMQPNAKIEEGFEANLYKSTRADEDLEKRLSDWLAKHKY
ncbi:MAG TPA: flavodoxin [Pasteurellaceae bacterium]|nr:flavodoxin [Pasteurellaceae bacterium]